jgi:ABC-2 type transport system permease protein
MTAIHSRLPGFLPFLRKELREWWHRRAALVTFVVVAFLGIMGAITMRIEQEAGGVLEPAMLEPTRNVIGAKLDQWVLLASIFASIGMLTQERASGTLAWTLSKPVSRNSVLLAKWAAATIMLGVFAVLLPLASMAVAATLAYGSAPDLVTLAGFGTLLIALPAFFVALNLALATRLDSQAGIAAIALAVAFAPNLIAMLLPAVAEAWPSSIALVARAVAVGEPFPASAIAGWAACLAVAGMAGLWALNREDM